MNLLIKKVENFLNAKKNLKILVSGAAGFIGSKICKKLIEQKYTVLVLTIYLTVKKIFPIKLSL